MDNKTLRPVLTLIDCEKLRKEEKALEAEKKAQEPAPVRVGAIVIPFPNRKAPDEDPEPPRYA